MVGRKQYVLKVKTVEVVLGDEAEDGLHERSAVGLSGNGRGEVLRASPATDGEHCLDVL